MTKKKIFTKNQQIVIARVVPQSAGSTRGNHKILRKQLQFTSFFYISTRCWNYNTKCYIITASYTDYFQPRKMRGSFSVLRWLSLFSRTIPLYTEHWKIPSIWEHLKKHTFFVIAGPASSGTPPNDKEKNICNDLISGYYSLPNFYLPAILFFFTFLPSHFFTLFYKLQYILLFFRQKDLVSDIVQTFL